MLTTSKEMLLEASKNGYAVPAINTQGGNYDIIWAICKAAEDLRSPIILAHYVSTGAYSGHDWFVNVCKWVKGAEKRVVEKGEGVVFCKLLSAAYLSYALLPCADVKALVFTDYHLVGNALKHLYSIFVRLAVGNHNEPVKAGADIFQHIADISVGNAVFIVEQENSQSFFSHFYLHYSVNS